MASRQADSICSESANAFGRSSHANRRQHCRVWVYESDSLRLQGRRRCGTRSAARSTQTLSNRSPVIVLDYLTEAQKRAYTVADNKLAINAGWDDELLALELAALKETNFDLSLTGFEDEELAQLMEQQDAEEGLTDEDAVPELQETIVSTTGDLWILGSHKLFVGDARIVDDVKRLMAGDAADLVFTDPPYNVDYEGYAEDRLKIRGDRMTPDEFQQFLRATFASYRSIMKAGGSLYTCHSSSWQREFQNAMESAGFEIRCQIIWAKKHIRLGLRPL